MVSAGRPAGPTAAREEPRRGDGAADRPGEADDGAGLIPPPDPPGVQGQSELPGTHVDPVRTSLGILATLAVAYTLYFAQSILLPIAVAVLLALLFRPVVRRLRKAGLPEWLTAAAILAVLAAVVAVGVYHVAAPASAFVNGIPGQLKQADDKVRTLVAPFRRINRALETGERLASGSAVPPAEGASDAAPAETPVRSTAGPAKAVDETGDGTPDEIVVRTNDQPSLSDWVLSQTTTFAAGATLSFLLLYFLLASGDDLLNNVLHVLPTFREKRGVVELVYAAEQAMSRYLGTVTAINVCLGIAEGIAMALLGVPNAPLWGVMACAFNFIPYVGALAGTGVVAFVSFLAFDSPAYALVPPAVYFALTGVEGNFVTPLVLGKRISLNPVIVFLALAFWGWIWGVGGALIAVPVLAMAKIACDQFEPLKPVGTLLGR